MKKYILTLFISLICLITNATVYYVTTSGSSGNTGLSIAQAWTFAKASTTVVAGDIVYVAAGTYTGNPTFTNSGMCGNTIQFIGYNTVPGDSPTLLVNNVSPYTAYSTTVMPTFTGTNRNTGICWDLRNKKYLTFKNFQIEAYAYGVITGGTTQTDYGFNTFYNVNLARLGDTGSSYDGRGFSLGNVDTSRSSYNNLQYCLVVNAQAEGITVEGNRNTIYGCKVYTNEAAHPTQYFITVGGNENDVNRCYIEQATAIAASGTHGYTLKSNAEKIVDAAFVYPAYNPTRNKIRNSTVRNINEGFCVRHRGVQYNWIDSCRAYGTHTGSSGASGIGNGIFIRDGASYNLFTRIYVDSCTSGITFDDTSEDGGAHTGNYNIIANSIIVNCYTPIKFGIDGAVAGDAGINTIANCSFYLTRYLHYCARRCTSMVYIANIYYGNSAVGSGGYFRGNTYSADVTGGQFTDCDFYNQEGGMPGGFVASTVNGYTVNPTYVNAASRDFRLQVSSGVIGKNTNPTALTGINTAQFATPNNNIASISPNQYNIRDFAGVIRQAYTPLDIGAFEYH